MTPLLIPYPLYASSSIPWPGCIPNHWKIARIKSQMDNVVDLTRRSSRGDIYVALEHVESWTGKIRDAGDDVNFESQVKRFQERDVLFGKLRPYLAKVTAPNRSGVCAGEFLVLRPLGHHLATKFLERFLRSKPIIDAVDASTFGAKMPRADWSFIGNMEMPVPPPDEQTAIVRFLDHADEQIQRYIAAKERLIKLLEEQRQALVHQAVTRGLDPNVRLKPSGVEWLGDVPEHWRIGPLKRAFVSMDYGISESASDSGTIHLLTMGNLRDGQVIGPHEGGVDSVDEYLLLREGDLLFNRTNSRELVGKVGLFAGHDSPTTFASYLVRMRPLPDQEPEYLNMALNDTSFISHARRESVPSLHQSNLNPTRYGRIHIALPPKDEQGAILRTLQKETATLRDSVIQTRRPIDLMNEYRTRLIADVVTGQLDVRKAAAQLPAAP